MLTPFQPHFNPIERPSSSSPLPQSLGGVCSGESPSVRSRGFSSCLWDLRAYFCGNDPGWDAGWNGHLGRGGGHGGGGILYGVGGWVLSLCCYRGGLSPKHQSPTAAKRATLQARHPCWGLCRDERARRLGLMCTLNTAPHGAQRLTRARRATASTRRRCLSFFVRVPGGNSRETTTLATPCRAWRVHRA